VVDFLASLEVGTLGDVLLRSWAASVFSLGARDYRTTTALRIQLGSKTVVAAAESGQRKRNSLTF